VLCHIPVFSDIYIQLIYDDLLPALLKLRPKCYINVVIIIIIVVGDSSLRQSSVAHVNEGS